MREKLVKGLATQNPSLSALVADNTTKLTVLETPFFHHHEIVFAQKFMPHRPQIAYLALGSKGDVTDITYNPQAYQAIAVADGLAMQSTTDALDYFKIAWQATTSRSELTYLVANREEFRFRPGLEGAEASRQADIEAKYADQIHPMQAEPEGAGFLISYFHVRDRNLEKVKVHVKPTGAFQQEVELLEADMPTVWGL